MSFGGCQRCCRLCYFKIAEQGGASFCICYCYRVDSRCQSGAVFQGASVAPQVLVRSSTAGYFKGNASVGSVEAAYGCYSRRSREHGRLCQVYFSSCWTIFGIGYSQRVGTCCQSAPVGSGSPIAPKIRISGCSARYININSAVSSSVAGRRDVSGGHSQCG